MEFNQQNYTVYNIIDVEDYELYTEEVSDVNNSDIINSALNTVVNHNQPALETEIQRNGLLPDGYRIAQETNSSIIRIPNSKTSINKSIGEIIPTVSFEEPVLNIINYNNSDAQITTNNIMDEIATKNHEISTNVAKDCSAVDALANNSLNVNNALSPLKTTESVFLKDTFPDEEMYCHWKQTEADMEKENNLGITKIRKSSENEDTSQKDPYKDRIYREHLVYIYEDDNPSASSNQGNNLPSKNTLSNYKYNEVSHPWNIVKRIREKQNRKQENKPLTPLCNNIKKRKPAKKIKPIIKNGKILNKISQSVNTIPSHKNTI